MESKTVLTIPNFHVASSGEAPDLKAGDGYYTAYLENEHGEQLIFQYSSATGGLLWHGDYSWEKPVEVVSGISRLINLEPAERAWLHLVWRIARRRRPGNSDVEENRDV